MKDIFGVPLEVGQTVAACVQFSRASYDLIPARIIGFTPKMVRISHKARWGSGDDTSLISAYKLAVKETP